MGIGRKHHKPHEGDLIMWGILPLEDLSSSFLLGLCVILILTGRLVPRAILNDKDAESQRWRSAYEAERSARVTSDEQTAKLVELSRTTHDIVAIAFGSRRDNHTVGVADGLVKGT
jgi:hypothetical protein